MQKLNLKKEVCKNWIKFNFLGTLDIIYDRGTGYDTSRRNIIGQLNHGW